VAELRRLDDRRASALAGACLFPVPAAINLLPHKLAEFIATNELTQWFSVPSVMTYLAKYDVIKPGSFPNIRRVILFGEVLTTPTRS
jgi:acyl-coenzyme A synthetase/AMP-(fatty) acid ligase